MTSPNPSYQPPAISYPSEASGTSHELEPSWDLIIEPHRGLFDLHLRDLYRYRDLVLLFVRRDFVAVYKQTILGPLWYLIQLLMYATPVIYSVLPFRPISSH